MCQHLTSQDYRLVQSYVIVQKYLNNMFNNMLLPLEIVSVLRSIKFCQTCRNDGPSLHACLTCVYISCHCSDLNFSHTMKHMQTESHHFCIDLLHGEIFCKFCEDYIYPPVFERIKCRLHSNYNFSFLSWEPSEKHINLLYCNPKRITIRNNELFGLRGLCNMGNTCFMNCIIQAIVHTPILKEFFLSESHRCFNFREAENCVVCELRNLVYEFHSGNKISFVPSKLLHLIWTHAHYMAGYEQQDAHEFFITTLEILHRHLGGKTPTAKSPQLCQCIIDSVFSGRLQSDLICQNCHHKSTTIDPFRDISLELGQVPPLKKISNTLETSTISLSECLERFTIAESLGTESLCSRCKRGQLMKKLSLKKIPLVLCIHLKRFKHSSQTKKIKQFVKFDLDLDIQPFLSNKFNSLESLYSLFAVVNHTGCVNSGHYTGYIRIFDGWYRCDDTDIRKEYLDNVLSSEAYLLFYHKKIIHYS